MSRTRFGRPLGLLVALTLLATAACGGHDRAQRATSVPLSSASIGTTSAPAGPVSNSTKPGSGLDFGSGPATGSGLSGSGLSGSGLSGSVLGSGSGSGSTNQPTDESIAPKITAEQAAQLADAEDEFTGACMIAHGFRYWPASAVAPPVEVAFPYVVDDPAWAAKYGYNSGFAASVATARATDGNSRYVATLSASQRADYLTALNGGGPGDAGVAIALPDGSGGIGHGATGCSVTSETRLYGNFATWFAASRLVAFYEPRVESAVLADPAYRAGVAAWSTCMTERGHPFSSPSAAHAAFAPATGDTSTHVGDTSTHVLTDQTVQIAVASAEAACATTAGLAATARAVESRMIIALGPECRQAYATERQLQLHALSQLPTHLGHT